MKSETKNLSMADKFFAIFGLYRIPKEPVVVKKVRKARKTKQDKLAEARIDMELEAINMELEAIARSRSLTNPIIDVSPLT